MSSADVPQRKRKSLIEAADLIDESLLNDGNDLHEFGMKSLYSCIYYVSFSVCFLGYLGGKLIPSRGLIGRAVCDGRHAAFSNVNRLVPDRH